MAVLPLSDRATATELQRVPIASGTAYLRVLLQEVAQLGQRGMGDDRGGGGIGIRMIVVPGEVVVEATPPTEIGTRIGQNGGDVIVHKDELVVL